MAKSNRQKIKLLKILEMLRQDSSEEKPLRTKQICERLTEMGISCDRRTLSTDIAMLRESGYDIGAKMIVHEKGYFIKENDFSVAELKILIDAVQAASFVTKEKTADLIEKIAQLGGTNRQEILRGNIVCFNTRKHTNEGIYANVATLENALQERRQASFFYFDRNEDGEKVYRKDKKRCTVEPMALIFHEDNYYLMCYSSKYEGVTNYRVDRMEDVSVENDSVSEKAIVPASDIAGYTEQVFKMYGGESTDVTLEFNDDLIGVVEDKFGEEIKIIRTSSDKCVASVKVQVSPTFWGWLFQFVGEMRILTPEKLGREFRKRASEAAII